MKKYIAISVILFTAFVLMPQKTKAQTYIHLDPYATYRMNSLYTRTRIAKAKRAKKKAVKKIVSRKSANRKKAVRRSRVVLKKKAVKRN